MHDLSELPDGWRTVQLGEIAEVIGGTTPSRAIGEYWGGDIPWVVPSELTKLTGRYLTATRESITDNGMKAAGLRIIPAGSVLLTSRATIGATAINSIPVVTNQGFQSLVSKTGIDCCWLFYCISAMRHELKKRASGSTFREISRGSVRSLPILLPPLSEQHAIAAVLDAIDGAIERTEAVIRATERLRDTLLHQLLTRGLPGWHTEWRSVPGLGTIPADWKVVRLGDAGHWLSGGTPSKARSDFWSGALPWVSPKDMKVRELWRTQDHISEEGSRAGSRVVPKGTIFVVVRGMILAHSFPIAVSRVAAAFNQDIRALVCRDGLLPDFVLAALQHQKPRLLQLPSPSTHGTMRVVSDDLFAIHIAMPLLAEQRAIAAALNGVDATIERVRSEHASLQASKASATEELLTGRVRVGQEQLCGLAFQS